MTLISHLKGCRSLAFNIVAGIAPAWDCSVALIGFLPADPDLPKLIPVEIMRQPSSSRPPICGPA